MDKQSDKQQVEQESPAKPNPSSEPSDELTDTDLEQIAGGGDRGSTWKPF
jgi:hypothetical protein